MGNFFTEVLQEDARFTSSARCADPLMLEPETRNRVAAIIADAKVHGVALMIWETFRSQARQTLLFQQGATRLPNVGVHHFGLACDILKDAGGEPSWKGDFSILATLARAHGLISGQDWGNPGVSHRFIDADHVQRIPLARQTSLFAGLWYPLPTYDPYADSA